MPWPVRKFNGEGLSRPSPRRRLLATLQSTRTRGERAGCGSSARAIAAVAAGVVLAACAAPYRGPDRFGIDTARLDGTDWTLILISATQQMTHPGVSPDGRWITFARYTDTGLDGIAEEKHGCLATEILVVRSDGSDVRVVVAPDPGVIAANSSRTPDGTDLAYLSTDNSPHAPQINQIDLRTRRVRRLPTPANLLIADPRRRRDMLAFPVVGSRVDRIWTMAVNGTDAHPVSQPRFPVGAEGGGFVLGDFDPRISPDGSRVACMRHFAGDAWHIVVLDIATGAKRDLSSSPATAILPNWSEDGRMLIFSHFDRRRPADLKLYVRRRDGKDRHMLPLPRGYVYVHSDLSPGDGASPKTRIAFAATRSPRGPECFRVTDGL